MENCTMQTPVKPKSGTATFLCQRDGSNTPSKIRHTRPSPSTPVKSSRIATTALSVFRDGWIVSGRGGKLGSLVFPFDWRHCRAGTGEHLGAKTWCVCRAGSREIPPRETAPCMTVNAYVPSKERVSPGAMTSTTAESPTTVEDSRHPICAEESANILLFHLGSKLDNKGGSSTMARRGGINVI